MQLPATEYLLNKTDQLILLDSLLNKCLIAHLKHDSGKNYEIVLCFSLIYY